MAQFRHETDDYNPFEPAENMKNRPFWVDADKLLLYDRLELEIQDRVVKISTLTKEEFNFYQKNKAIPPEYKFEDWQE